MQLNDTAYQTAHDYFARLTDSSSPNIALGQMNGCIMILAIIFIIGCIVGLCLILKAYYWNIKNMFKQNKFLTFTCCLLCAVCILSAGGAAYVNSMINDAKASSHNNAMDSLSAVSAAENIQTESAGKGFNEYTFHAGYYDANNTYQRCNIKSADVIIVDADSVGTDKEGNPVDAAILTFKTNGVAGKENAMPTLVATKSWMSDMIDKADEQYDSSQNSNASKHNSKQSKEPDNENEHAGNNQEDNENSNKQDTAYELHQKYMNQLLFGLY